MRVDIPLIGPAYQSRELPVSAQVTKNLLPEIHSEGKTFVSLHNFPGLTSFASLAGKDRGLFVHNDVLYAVNGTALYSIDSAGSDTSLGTITGAGRCDFAGSDSQLAITTGSTAYVYTTTLAEITDHDLVNPTTVGYLNSQFLYDNNGATSSSGEFITTSVDDATDVSALDFAVAESHPDDLLRILINNQLVYFMGSKSIEPWYNSGVGRPPFDRVQGGVKPYGLCGAWAADTLNEVIYFVDHKRIPRVLSGVSVLPIGNITLQQEWDSYSDVSDCIVQCMTLETQDLVFVTFPEACRSWMYHVSSNSWIQLSYGVDDERHRMSSYAYVYGKHIVADHSTGDLFELDFTKYTDNGDVIQRKRTTATIHGGLYGAPNKEIFYERVYFDVQTGEGITTGQGSDPQLMVRFSDDNGRTWSAEEMHSLGVGGAYLTRVQLDQQGAAYNRIYELTYTDPTEFTLLSAQADIEVGE